MKCLTLNAHSFREELPLKRLFDLAEHILEVDYDVICLQEINQALSTPVAKDLSHFTALADFPSVHEDNYALYLVNYLKQKGQRYYWSWVYNHISYDTYNEGVAILSKTPFEAQSLLVSDKDDEFDYNTRRVLIAKTTIDDKALTVVNLHMSPEEAGFQKEWQRLEEVLMKESKPCIVLGNFNVDTNSDGYKRILASPLDLADCHMVAKDTRGEFTVCRSLEDGTYKEVMMDHVFVSKAFKVELSCVSFDGGDAPVVSDHYGLTVDVSLKE
ncbi:endonuclease/exonuclease/phosphatase family protein [Streptococcus sp. zg-JUN1979]|uniref:endonuclease/exonuclease/phosphatase family protein n=1 Tax=Streptococcus sp. zg-JUN1979 TaxID=3391450 RepID=UPI0039A6458F